MSTNIQDITIRQRMIGYAQTLWQLQSITSELNKQRLATARLASAQSNAARRTFLHQQAVFTLRRGLYSATLGIGVMTAGLTAMGFNFNRTMEANTASMKFFLGSTQAAEKELEFLFDLAAHTPFEFPQLVKATNHLLAFGLTVEQANATTRILGDAVAGLGGGAAEIDRAVLALGQMQAKGRIMGEELLQLTELGIPATQILQEELGLTAKEVQRIGLLGISSAQGIPALLMGMQKRFKGAAELQGKTFNGMISTARDVTGMLMGSLTQAMFNLTKGALGDFIAAIEKLQKNFKEGGGGIPAFIKQLDSMANAHGFLTRGVYALANILQSLAKIWTNVLWPAMRPTVMVLIPLAVLSLQALGETLEFVGDNATAFKWILMVMIPMIVITRIGSMVWAIYTFITALKLARVAAILFGKSTAAVNISMRLMRWSVWLTTGVLKGFRIAVLLATKAVFSLARMILVVLAPVAVAIGIPLWALIAIILVLAALAFLVYKKWDWFKDKAILIWNAIKVAFSFVVDWIKSHWKDLLLFIFAPWAFAAYKLWDPIKNAFRRLLRWIRGAWEDFKKEVSSWSVPMPKLPGFGGFGIPGTPFRFPLKLPFGLAEGGQITRSGVSVIGEKGPELLFAPTGSTVVPLDPKILSGLGEGTMTLNLRIPVFLDKRQIAEASQSYRLDRAARF
jgi:tape measure domain-containing protein